MTMQQTVYTDLSTPVEGDFYDNSPRRVDPYIIDSTAVVGVKASGAVTAGTTNATADDTVSVAGTTYTFKASPDGATEVEVGDTVAESLTNLAAVVNANNAFVTAVADTTKITFTAKEVGTAGNAYALAASAWTAGSFSGGVNPVSVTPKVGFAFGFKSDDTVTAGNNFSKGFAGILVSSKQYANLNNLEPTLQVSNGIHGEFCTFGRIWVKSKHQVQPGYLGCFNSTTGEIGAATASDAVPSGFELIPNSEYKFFSVSAGELAVLQMGD